MIIDNEIYKIKGVGISVLQEKNNHINLTFVTLKSSGDNNIGNSWPPDTISLASVIIIHAGPWKLWLSSIWVFQCLSAFLAAKKCCQRIDDII